jgi:hypothetical protein
MLSESLILTAPQENFVCLTATSDKYNLFYDETLIREWKTG